MQPAAKMRRRSSAFFLSTGFHAGVLTAVLLMSWIYGRSVVQRIAPKAIAGIEIAGGSHRIPVELPPMFTAARTRHPAPRTEATRTSTLPVALPRPALPSGGGSPANPRAGEGSGRAVTGDGSDAQNATPAFPVFSPRPPVTDRSLLPASERKIVVDVNVNASGQVVSEDLVTGIGNRLDQIVLSTVKSWRFQPAKVDGKPVATQAELIFPFDLNYPVDPS